MAITSTLKPVVDSRERIQDTISTGMKPLTPAFSVQEESKKTIPEAASSTQPDKTGELDPRMEQLAKRERAIRNQARQLEQQKRDWEAKINPPKPAPTIEDFKQQFLKDPSSLGLSYEDIANVAMSAPTPENQQLNALNAKIAELEAKLSGTDQKITSAQEKAYSDAVKQISREVESIVGNNESFEMIRATSNQAAVVALIEETYKEEGYVMTSEDAAKQVEEYLVDKNLKIASLKKIQEKLNPQMEQPLKPQRQSQTSTLTRATTVPSTQTLSPKDRKARAIAAFQGKL